MDSNDPQAEESRLWGTVGASLQLYRAMVTIVTVFMGFVFAVLVQTLKDVGVTQTTVLNQWVVLFLFVGFTAFKIALILLHGVAHQVVRRWKIFYPASGFEWTGTVLIAIGILSMEAMLAIQIYSISGAIWAGLVVFFAIPTIVLFMCVKRIIPKDAPYKIRVGRT
jgi:hypothetical protein